MAGVEVKGLSASVKRVKTINVTTAKRFKTINVTIGAATVTSPGYTPPAYEGEYNVTPTKDVQRLNTDGFLLEDNVTVDPIPDEYIVPEGTKKIVSNGEHDVNSFEKVNVDVPNEIPDGYIKPEGERQISSNGSYDVKEYATAEVNVPIPDGYIIPAGAVTITQNGNHDVTKVKTALVIVPTPDGYLKPSGTKQITSNGTHDVKQYESAEVNVPIPEGYIKPSGTKKITSNGEHDAREYESVDVDVPIPDGYIQPSGQLEITENGEYDITDKASVIVAVEEGTVLPALSNPAAEEQIVVGYDAINDKGAVVVGTNPYEKSATDEEVNTQADLIEQLTSILKGKAAGSGGITISDINLHDTSTDKANIYLSGDKEVAYNGWDATDYIAVRADRSYLIYSTQEISGQYCNRYNASKTRIGGMPTPCNGTVRIAPFLYPGFDGYLRFSGTRQQIANLAVFEANALALEVSE